MSSLALLCAITSILYIRHGEVPGNDPKPETYVYTGSATDESLTDKGKLQAKACADRISRLQESGRLGEISAIYASDLKRAQETAEPIGQELGLEVQLSENLREIYWGRADGQLVHEMAKEYKAIENQVKARYPERRVQWDYLPVFENAETYNALLKRSADELQRIGNEHPGETVVVVGHGRVLKTLIAESLDSEEGIPYPANCGIARFSYSPEEGIRFIEVIAESGP